VEWLALVRDRAARIREIRGRIGGASCTLLHRGMENSMAMSILMGGRESRDHNLAPDLTYAPRGLESQ
jgi:hypothetical protein